MDQAGTSAEPATERIGAADYQRAERQATKPFWRRMSPTLLGCLLATVAFTAALAVAAVIEANTGDVGIDTLSAIGGGLTFAFMGSLAAGLRDFVDQRTSEAEVRIRGLVLAETYRIETSQTAIRTELGHLRSELHALLGQLPDGIVRYGDEREDQGEARAVRRLSAASEPPDPSPRFHLRSVDSRH